MLQQEQVSAPELLPSAQARVTPEELAQARVTPEELAQALLRVEARQAAQGQTVPLGEAVRDLGVSASLDELLAEVQALRAEKATGQKRKARPFWKIVAAASLAVNLGLAGSVIYTLRNRPQAAPLPAVSVTAPDSTVIVPQLKPYSDVAEGQTFHCDVDTLLKLAKPNAPSDIIVDVNPQSRDLWTLARTRDSFELRGWTSEAGAIKLQNGGEARVWRDYDPRPLYDFQHTPVTISAERLRRAQAFPDSEEVLTLPKQTKAHP